IVFPEEAGIQKRKGPRILRPAALQAAMEKLRRGETVVVLPRKLVLRPHRALQLAEGTHLDLPDALARHGIAVAQFFECHRLVLDAARENDFALARLKLFQRAI